MIVFNVFLFRHFLPKKNRSKEVLSRFGLAVFGDPKDGVDPDILEGWHQDFRNYWEKDVLPKLQQTFSEETFWGRFFFQKKNVEFGGTYFVRF